jgi:hypothetical protein
MQSQPGLDVYGMEMRTSRPVSAGMRELRP